MNTQTARFDKTVNDDDPIIVATQLYETHGYQKALQTVIRYIASAEDYCERFEWERIAKEIDLLNNIDKRGTARGSC